MKVFNFILTTQKIQIYIILDFIIESKLQNIT